MSESDRSQRSQERPQKRTRNNPTDQDIFEVSALNGTNIEESLDGVVEEGKSIFDIIIPNPPPPPCTGERLAKQRLIIHHLVLKNFKSYSGKVEVGPFNQYLTCIMGPNGSGKSNVVDAMIFAFGFTAKKMRATKLSTLINSANPYAKSAKVEVHFVVITPVGDGTYAEVPGSRFSIKRTVYKETDKAPAYFLDGHKTQWRNIFLKLREYDIDLIHNRFLILQGDVEKVTLMKAMATKENEYGMLEYLDEVIGTERYKKPIQQMEKKKREFTLQLGIMQRNLRLLKDTLAKALTDKDHAVNFLKCENRFSVLKHKWCQRKIFNLTKEYEKFDVEKKRLENILEELEREMEELSEENVAKNKEKELRNKELKAKAAALKKLEDEKSRVDKLRKELEEDEINLDTEQANTSNNIKTKRDVLAKSVKTMEENAKKVEKLQEALPQIVKDRDEARCVLVEKTKELAEATKKIYDEKKALETAPQKKALEEKRGKMQSKHGMVMNEFEGYKHKEDQEGEKLDKLKKDLEVCTQKKVDRTRQLDEVNVILPAKEAEYAELDDKVKDLKLKLSSTENKLKGCKVKMEELEKRQVDNVHRNKVMQKLKEFEKEGLVSGIYGRLGDLGCIEAKYDVAISTACGGYLNSYVVSTQDVARTCISLLKDRNTKLRGTFIDLEKMTKQYGRASQLPPRQHPENTTCLYDMIKVKDDRMKPVFYCFCNRILVTKDKMQSKRILTMQKGYRMVTYDGDLTESNGSVSAGGTQQYRGSMGTTVAVDTNNVTNPVDVEELRRLKENIPSILKEVNELKSNLHSYSELMDSFSVEIPALKQDESKFAKDIEKLKAQEKSLVKNIKEQEKICDSVRLDSAKAKEYEEKLKAIKNECDEVEKALLKYDEKTKILDAKIDEFTKEITEEAQHNFEKPNAAVVETEKKITKLKMEINQSKQLEDRTKHSLENLERILVNLDGKKRELASRREKLENDLQDVNEEKMKTLQEETEILHKILDEIVNRTAEIMNRMSELQKQKEHECRALGPIMKKFEEFQKLVPRYEAEMEEHKRQWHHIPEFDDLDDLEAQFRPGIENDEDREEEEHVKRMRRSKSNRHGTKDNESDALQGQAEEENFPILSMEELQSKDCNYYERRMAAEEENKKNFHFIKNAIDVYIKKVAEYRTKYMIYKNLVENALVARSSLDEMLKTRKECFRAGFNVIARKMKEIYRKITMGGDVELELVNTLDPYEGGVTLLVRPLEKTWKLASNLSGGEKTLSSLALVFALHYYRPTPFYFMDEIDAALDVKNVAVIGHFISHETENAQFIVVSLRFDMLHLAEYLAGVCKGGEKSCVFVIDQKMIMEQNEKPDNDDMYIDSSDDDEGEENPDSSSVKNHVLKEGDQANEQNEEETGAA